MTRLPTKAGSLNVARQPVATWLDATLLSLYLLTGIDPHIRQTRRAHSVEKESDLTMQRRRVVLESQE